MKNEFYDSEQVIEEILKGGDKALRAMYPRYERSFMAWVKSWNYGFDDDTLIEAYMEAIKVFYINVRTGRVTHLKSSVENYLIGVGKLYLLKKAQQNKRILPPDNLEFTLSDNDNFLTQTIASELSDEHKTKLRLAFADLGEQCQKLLKLVFYENKSASEIKEIMNFENDNTLYASKARCLKKLKKLFTKY